MPLTSKGKKVQAAMRKQYGRKKGDAVFYASVNKGKVKGAHSGKKRSGGRKRGGRKGKK